MVRRALSMKRFALADVRDMGRHDQQHFDWLVENGLFKEVGPDRYELTEKGRAAADLGYYDWEPAPKVK
jgi:hypothetical protein